MPFAVSLRGSAVLFLGLGLLLSMTGCGFHMQDLGAPVSLTGRTIHGNVHGGPFPIQGATIRLMQTLSNGYGGAAKSLLQTTSDAGGYFTFPDTGWSCDSNQFAYITVTGGHTAAQANNNVGQIGVIGRCGDVLANTAEVDAVNVYVSELSTIAAAYALRSFISVDSTNAVNGQQIINISAPAANNASTGNCSSGSAATCVAAGLAHGFANAYNLVDSVTFNGQMPTGEARTSLPGNGFAYVPQAMINALGNILQSCVDSGGGVAASPAVYSPGGTSSTRCGDLFFWATPPGGIAPTNTLQAALNMAQYPTNNVSQLFALQPRAVFFTPTLSGVPNDLSLSIFYLTQTFGTYTGALTNPVSLALDANDNVYSVVTAGSGTGNSQTAVLGLSSAGSVLFAGQASTKYLNPTSIAVDQQNNLWLTNNSSTSGALVKADAYTGAMTEATQLNNAAGVAVDRRAGVWVLTNNGTASGLNDFRGSDLIGGVVAPLLKSSVYNGSLATPTFDASQSLWLVGNTAAQASAAVFPNTGFLTLPIYPSNMSTQALSGSNGFGVAPGAGGLVYFPLKNQLNTANYSGGLATNNRGTYAAAAQNSASYNSPNEAEADGAGNVFWTDLEASGQVYQYLPPGSGSLNQGTLNALQPCYPVEGNCYVPAVSNVRGMRIDSTGALWYLADATYFGYPIGVVMQTLGVGTPTWPLLAFGRPATMPQ